MVGLTIAIGILVGLEIPFLMRILAPSGGVRRSVAHVLGLDYVGALIGSLAFPLLLLPHLGLFRASFAIALLNLLVAIVTLIAFAGLLRRFRLLLAVTACIGIALVAGITFASWITSFAEDRLFAERVVLRQQTPYQRIIVTMDELSGEHRLYLDGHLQFAERDEHRYHEGLVHPVMAAGAPPRDVLILGGGDGLAVREVLRHASVERVYVVDIDPAMTDLGRDFPVFVRLNEGSLADPRVHVVNVDAFTWVRDADPEWDRVIIDLPDPHGEGLAKLYSVEFYRLVARCLRPGGAMVTQATSPFFTREAFWSIARTMEAADLRVHSYRLNVPSFGDWGFHLAAAGPMPTTIEVDVPTRFLTTEVFAAAGVFGLDTGPVDVPVNSVFEPRLYLLYRGGVDR
jgi:spermidine synthase